MAFNNLPGALVRSDNTLFGENGSALQVMKETYQENTSLERSELEQIVKRLMSNFKEPKDKIELIPLIEIVEREEEPKTVEDASETDK